MNDDLSILSERILETDRWIIDREATGEYTVVDLEGRAVYYTGVSTLKEAYAIAGLPAPAGADQ